MDSVKPIVGSTGARIQIGAILGCIVVDVRHFPAELFERGRILTGSIVRISIWIKN